MNFNKYQRVAMGALPLAIMLNPLTIQIYMEWVVRVLEGVGLLAAGYLVVFMLYKVLKPEIPNLPKKNKKRAVPIKEYLNI